MSASHTLKSEIGKLQAEIKPLFEKMIKLQSELDDAESREFIEVNQIKKSDVQFSRCEGVPFHGDIYGFSEWMKKTNCQKDWCEWNGRIYRTSDVITGRIKFKSPAKEEHLQ